jgi:hypothetical protein
LVQIGQLVKKWCKFTAWADSMLTGWFLVLVSECINMCVNSFGYNKKQLVFLQLLGYNAPGLKQSHDVLFRSFRWYQKWPDIARYFFPIKPKSLISEIHIPYSKYKTQVYSSTSHIGSDSYLKYWAYAIRISISNLFNLTQIINILTISGWLSSS